MNSDAVTAVLLVDCVVDRAKARLANAVAHGVIPLPHARCRGSARNACPLFDIMYPVLELLRSSSLPAANTLESAIVAQLEAGHKGTAWVELAEAICKKCDVALATPLVDGVLYYVKATLASRTLASDSKASKAGFCPFLQIMRPIWEMLSAASLPMADKLSARLKAELDILALSS